MRWLVYSVFAITLSSPVGASAAGPFGINMGDQPDGFGCSQSSENALLYTCNAVPLKHPDIEMYIVRSTPETGICWVKGVTRDIETNAFGNSLKSSADKLSSQISQKYGKAEKNDFLRSGSIWNDTNDWTMGLLKKERFYSYVWENPKADNNVESVFVSAQAMNTSVGFVGVEFAFSNYDTCEKAEDKAGAGAF